VRLFIPNRITFLFGIFFSNRLFDCSDAKDMADFLDARPLSKPSRNLYFLKPGIFPMAEPGSNALNETERWQAIAEALPQAVETLAGALDDPRTAVRSQAIQALGSLARKIQEVQFPIRKALKRVSLWEDDDAIRALAVEQLVQIGEWSRTAIADLVAALNDPSAPIRFSAAQELGERASESHEAVGLLLQKALRDPDGGVRLEAAMALYKIDRSAEKILPMLIKALQDPDEVRRWIAADCLGEIGPQAREAIPALRDVLQKEFKSALVRTRVALALQKITGPTETTN
jgi:HEAT repeat protein